jgi:hypothetical protein
LAIAASRFILANVERARSRPAFCLVDTSFRLWQLFELRARARLRRSLLFNGLHGPRGFGLPEPALSTYSNRKTEIQGEEAAKQATGADQNFSPFFKGEITEGVPSRLAPRAFL